MILPAPLLHWQKELSFFREDLAEDMFKLLRPLDLAIGPLKFSQEDNEGEPDGFQGITNKGDFSRLLPTEWLLADVFPQEFLRKAASGEQLFLRQSFQKPHGSGLSMALLDSGPAQLGNPRILQLAVLIVLARRALLQGYDFTWGSLQQDTLVENFDKEAAKTFLACRTFTELDTGHVKSWQKCLEHTNTTVDLWIIGARETATLFPSTQNITICDTLQPGSKEIDVTVTQKARKNRLKLQLPHDETCTWLLRDPFKKPPQRAHRTMNPQAPVSTDYPIRIFSKERRALIVAGPNRVRLYKLKFNQKKTHRGIGGRSGNQKSKNHCIEVSPPENHSLLGTTIADRRLVLLTRKKKILYLFNLRIKHYQKNEYQHELVIKDFDRRTFRHGDNRMVEIFYFPQRNRQRYLLLLDRQNRLFRLKRRGDVYTLVLLAEHVLGTKQMDERLFYATQQPGEKTITVHMWKNGNVDKQMDSTWNANVKRVIFQHQFESNEMPHIAVQTGKTQWRVLDGNTGKNIQSFALFKDVEVFALNKLFEGNTDDKPAGDYGGYWSTRKTLELLALNSDKKSVETAHGTMVFTRFKAKERIAQVALCPGNTKIAYLTESGVLKVYNLKRRQIVYSSVEEDQ
ncbi:MAG: hypothetical protein GY757_19535 [bacterium]|nr:hypothetical protein [bacterium]